MFAVTYASFWSGDCDLHTDTQVFANFDEALALMKSHIKDIRELGDIYYSNNFSDSNYADVHYCASAGDESFWDVKISVV